MYKTFRETIAWWEQYSTPLAELAQKAEIVLCPTFPALGCAEPYFRSSEVKLGAQTCSWTTEGDLTGEVSVASLKELGCSYCIVGHSERRSSCGESNERIAYKVFYLLCEQITPILCIGEAEKWLSKERREEILSAQLSVLGSLAVLEYRSVCIAYEPVWAIGTGDVPSIERIQEVVAFISGVCREFERNLEVHIPFHILYGGSVNSKNASSLWKVKGLDGFLVGSASVDFKSFQKIVQSHR